MAHSFQSSTLSLTLPISCQICLGKVRQPVICANYHVFCSTCMEMWLKNASQCPTCRVLITTENPCREIIGGTTDSEHSKSHSVRKHLRKTRGELLLSEYEDEIEVLLRENDELKTKNQSLESQLTTVLDPCSMGMAETTEGQGIDTSILEEWTNKLQTATDLYSKVKQDMEKLKEANKTLRSQNVDLVQENMRLKSEVASRSPSKFGRYTVAALEAKIQQYERDVDHLKRALERSDLYIEDLESRGGSEPENNRLPDLQDTSPTGDGKMTGQRSLISEQQKIEMMRKSLSDNERELVCSNTIEAECHILTGSNRGFSAARVTSSAGVSSNRRGFGGGGGERLAGLVDDDMDSSTTSSSHFLPLPSTPSSAFRSLTLKSPGIRSEKKVSFKASYLRRLSFEELVGPGNISINALVHGPGNGSINALAGHGNGGINALAGHGNGSITAPATTTTTATRESQFSTSCCNGPEGKDSSFSADVEPSAAFWGAWQSATSTSTERSSSPPGPSKEPAPPPLVVNKGATSSKNLNKDSDRFENNSEASMDAAYLDKISELDSMMLEGGESSSSRGSQPSLASSPSSNAFDTTLLPEPKSSPDMLTCGEAADGSTAMVEDLFDAFSDQQSQCPFNVTDGTGRMIAPEAQAAASMEEKQAARPLSSCGEGGGGGGAHALLASSQSDELSYDVPVDPSLSENKASPSGHLSPAGQHQEPHASPLSSGTTPGNTMRERHTVNTSQPTKRKSHSPFNFNSPTKLSKRM